MGISPALYDFATGLFRSRASQAGVSDTRPNRPDSPLIWLHGGNQSDQNVINNLTQTLLEMDPDLCFLVTAEPGQDFDCPENCVFVTLPADTQANAAKFLQEWRPEAGAWMAGTLRPNLLAQAHALGLPILLFDTGVAYEISRQRLVWPGLKSASLRKFQGILVGDQETQQALAAAGADAENIEITGVLEDAVAVPPCNESEREILASMLHTRPVWLAAQINRSELDGVLAAHMQVMRRTHRLLLILVPESPEMGDEFAEMMDERNIAYLRRTEGDEPEIHAQVYLADTEDEMGLWYRLAPITFVGQTLADRLGTGPNPFQPASLGSVVVHGPGLSPHQNAFLRLSRAGASRQVSHSGELASTIEELIAPDKAAELAHAAWQISSAGAEVQERAVELLLAARTRKRNRK